eukprot:UN10949
MASFGWNNVCLSTTSPRYIKFPILQKNGREKRRLKIDAFVLTNFWSSYRHIEIRRWASKRKIICMPLHTCF